MDTVLPNLDIEKLQQKAQEAAMTGALKEIEEYYSGYNSPFRKAIQAGLQGKEIGYSLQLPDIIAVLNTRISAEVDCIANTAIANSFLPLVKRMLTRAEKEINFSDILKEYIDEYDSTVDNDDYQVEIEKNEKYGWLNVEISNGKKTHNLTLHVESESKNQGKERYCILSLPTRETETRSSYRTMKLQVDGATLTMPFTPDVLRDEFTAFIARLIIAQTSITVDRRQFEDDMFPEHCRCH